MPANDLIGTVMDFHEVILFSRDYRPFPGDINAQGQFFSTARRGSLLLTATGDSIPVDGSQSQRWIFPPLSKRTE
jgi:hypothetical protein